MKLDTLNWKLLMPQAHDRARTILLYCRGTDFQVCGQIMFRNNQRVIAGRGHRRRQSAKNGPPIMLHLAGLPVHQIGSSYNLSTKRRANRLMSETNYEQLNFARDMHD